MTKSSLGELWLTVISLAIERSQDRESKGLKELKQWPLRNVDYLLSIHSLMSLLSHITQAYLTRVGTTFSELGLPVSIINEENDPLDTLTDWYNKIIPHLNIKPNHTATHVLKLSLQWRIDFCMESKWLKMGQKQGAKTQSTLPEEMA